MLAGKGVDPQDAATAPGTSSLHRGEERLRGVGRGSGEDAGETGLIDTSQQLGGAIGIAVASTVAAAHSRTLLGHGYAPAAALTGGFGWALWVSGLVALAGVPVTFLLIRRTELAKAAASTLRRVPTAPADAD